jgi:lipoprotein-anchoring transpeptidase ErfK/SrfK
MKLYLNPIYTNKNKMPKKNKWIRVFITVIIIHIIGFVYYLKFKTNENVSAPIKPVQSSNLQIEKNVNNEDTDNYSKILEAINNNDLDYALTMIISEKCNSKEVIDQFNTANLKRLRARNDNFNKSWYVVKSGDALSKIAKKYNTTVSLIKSLNNKETDIIRVGERLLVFNGKNSDNKNTFSIYVSKSKNTLDLLVNDKLFKRYPVGTGKFGKTPEVDFFVYDKIEEPPWTRPSDNKIIEYGDPENVLGTRWFALKSPENKELIGFGIHGTWERDSIGHQSSDGCVRMFNEDVEELFDLIPRNTKVTITK